MKATIVPIIMFLAFSQTVMAQQEKPMYEIHAAMIFNFLKYIQWPPDEGSEFIVGVMGEDDVFNTLKSYYDGKPKGSKKYVIRKLNTSEEAAECAVVYIGKKKSKDFDSIKSAISGKTILTITDSFNLGQKGSCVNFKVVDGKLKFELNQASIASSNLKVATQLSSMAIQI